MFFQKEFSAVFKKNLSLFFTTSMSMASMVAFNTVSANEIDLALSDDMIDLKLITEFEKNYSGKLALMKADHKDIDSHHLSYTFGTVSDYEFLRFGLAAQAYWLDAEDEDGYGIALGGSVEGDIVTKLTLSASYLYTPDILSGGDLDNTGDFDVRLSYQLLENGSVFAGYRDLDVDTDDFDFAVYDSGYVGVKFSF